MCWFLARIQEIWKNAMQMQKKTSVVKPEGTRRMTLSRPLVPLVCSTGTSGGGWGGSTNFTFFCLLDDDAIVNVMANFQWLFPPFGVFHIGSLGPSFFNVILIISSQISKKKEEEHESRFNYKSINPTSPYLFLKNKCKAIKL